jgi:hypothetical protein
MIDDDSLFAANPMKTYRYRLAMVTGTTVAIFLLIACARQGATNERQEGAHGAHTFSGKVEQVDVTAKTLTVNGEDVDGWRGCPSSC